MTGIFTVFGYEVDEPHRCHENISKAVSDQYFFDDIVDLGKEPLLQEQLSYVPVMWYKKIAKFGFYDIHFKGCKKLNTGDCLYFSSKISIPTALNVKSAFFVPSSKTRSGMGPLKDKSYFTKNITPIFYAVVVNESNDLPSQILSLLMKPF